MLSLWDISHLSRHHCLTQRWSSRNGTLHQTHLFTELPPSQLQPSHSCFLFTTLRRIPKSKKKLLNPRVVRPLLWNHSGSLHPSRIWPCLSWQSTTTSPNQRQVLTSWNLCQSTSFQWNRPRDCRLQHQEFLLDPPTSCRKYKDQTASEKELDDPRVLRPH